MMGQIGTAIAGNLTLSSGATGTTWVSPSSLGTNESMNINDWSQVELQNFVKWFIEVNHPEAVKEYQAVRAIERKIQEEERIQQELAYQVRMAELLRNQTQTAYTNPQSIYTTLPGQALTITSPPKKESIWDAMKRMAGVRKPEHGDYY